MQSAPTDDHDALLRRLRKRHISAGPHSAYHKLTALHWIRTTLSDIYYYCFVWFPTLSFETFASLPGLLLDPIGFGSALVFLVGSAFILFLILVFSAVWRLPLVQSIWRPYSQRKDVGLGNIVYPQIFDFQASPINRQIRDAAFSAMSSPEGSSSTAEERVFDLEVSKMLLILAALVYERDAIKVNEAAKRRAQSAQAHNNLLGEYDELTEAGLQIDSLFEQANHKITRVANDWGLKYSTISELATDTSPLCGAFWNPKYNFLVIAFKGTNPVEFKEWAIDFTFNYTDGRAWLPGFTKVHSGFYNQIFPQKLSEATEPFPYTEIRTTIADISEQIRATSGSQHINLYVTGHSLGAALASLFYSRALMSPKDFGSTSHGADQIRVRDAYCFGTPIVGDPDCVSAFNQACHDQNLDHPQTLWRITNKRDAVATLLPEAGDYNVLKHISPTSQLHFAHIGQEMQLVKDDHGSIKVFNGPGTLLPTMSTVSVVSHLAKDRTGPSVKLPTYFRLLEYIPLIRRAAAHAPSSYWASLTKVHQEHNVEYRSFH